MLVNVLEQIESFVVDATERLMQEVAIAGRETTFSDECAGNLRCLLGVCEVKTVLFNSVQHVVDLCHNQAVAEVK